MQYREENQLQRPESEKTIIDRSGGSPKNQDCDEESND